MNPATLIALIAVMLLLLVLSFRLSMFLARRAICVVINTFRERNAVQAEKAIPLESLGFNRWVMFRLLKDYRPWAFYTLLQAGIIKSSLEGWFYLSEEKLESAPGIKCEPPRLVH